MSIGFASCVGGQNPDPPIHDYPLLVYVGGEVRTEDGSAAVDAIAAALESTPNVDDLARKFGTTHGHVVQALHYAAIAARPLT